MSLRSLILGIKMAELAIGKQCSVLSCKQLDFLPFTCSDCWAIFCLEHRSTTSHNCSGKTQEDKLDSVPSNERSVAVKCSFDSCNVRELLPVKCELCERAFCVRHRHEQDHLCPKQETALKDEKQKLQIQKKEKLGRGGVKSNARAAKVALMKMKLHAVGETSTPQIERVYFSVILPPESPEKSKHAMFFSKKWTVGRAIDQIARMCKLKNQNNQESAKKLRLFNGFSKKQLVIGNTLETEMNENPETLVNGSELILDYVDES